MSCSLRVNAHLRNISFTGWTMAVVMIVVIGCSQGEAATLTPEARSAFEVALMQQGRLSDTAQCVMQGEGFTTTEKRRVISEVGSDARRDRSATRHARCARRRGAHRGG